MPVETVRTETVTEHDSVFLEVVKHDSVATAMRGDTVYVERWHTLYKDRWRDRWRDSVRVDSIAVPYAVEKELTWWQRQKLAYGEFLVFLAMLLAAVVLLKLLKLWSRN